MALAVGARLGPYEILAPLGAGGTGEVWRARDVRVGREVALKVLPADFLKGEEGRARRERFEREAKLLASLNHRNVAVLYSFEEILPSSGAPPRHVLAMELLEGETLRESLMAGPLSVRRALDLAAQIAEGLAAAHEAGIVHRDVKPENVALTKDGRVKLLDFSLARHDAQRGDPALTRAPTITDVLPERPVTGTVEYMSPEQASGRPVDFRSDQFSFGIVLYEMLAGLRPFRGESATETIAAILRDDPEPLVTRAPSTPAPVRWLVERLLSKEPSGRFDSTRDLASDLASLRTHLSEASLPAGAPPRDRRRAGRIAAVIAVTALIGLAAGFFGRSFVTPTSARPVAVWSTLEVGPAEEIHGGGAAHVPGTPGGSRTAMQWTPDGRSLVFVGRRDGVQRLYVRALEVPEARPIEGTAGAAALAISPDGTWAAFWSKGAIRRVPLRGGPVTVLVDEMPIPTSGMSWGQNGRLFYSSQAKIWSVEPEHTPQAVTKSGTPGIHLLPQALPGGQRILYTVKRRDFTWADAEVVAEVLATGERRVLLREAADARFVSPGHLIFLRRGTLFGVGFDLSRLEVHGTPVPVLENVTQALTGANAYDVTGAGHFSVSSSGALAYLPGPPVPPPDADLVGADRQGRVRVLGAPRRNYSPAVALSLSARRLVGVSATLTEKWLWTYEIETGKSLRLPAPGDLRWPRWTPDGQRISFEWKGDVAWQGIDGATAPESLWAGAASLSSWSPDGRRAALLEGGDIRIGTLENGKLTVAPWLQTPAEERWPEISPDGRWIAYGSDASGRFEVYVQPFPGPGPRQLVSVDGGESPAWNPAGRELFFLSPRDSGKRQMMVVDLHAGSELTLGRPRPLFDFPEPPVRFGCANLRCYAVSPDGKTFYGTQYVSAPSFPPVTKIHLVQNWAEELRARVAAGN